ncbi:multiple C2 and transmembrane domain-containing protein 1-like isoform X2 [Styela clava]
MSSQTQNNNNLDKLSLDKKHDMNDNSGSFGSSPIRKSKKKKKLGLFSFRSKKSKTVTVRRDNLTADHSDSASVCSEILTSEDGSYSSITTTTHLEKHVTKLERSRNSVANHSSNLNLEELEENILTTEERVEDLNSHTTVITTTENEDIITVVTPFNEDEQIKNSHLSQKHIVDDTVDHITDTQIQQGREGPEINHNTETKHNTSTPTVLDNDLPHSSKHTSAEEESPERPNSIYLDANRHSGIEGSSFRKSLARRKQKIFAENRSSSTDCSSYPVSPVKSKTKSKKGKMSNYTGATHQLRVRLLSGQNLAARDSTGLSDPYVKFKFGSRTLYKSSIIKANLNPKWDEEFTTPVRMSDLIHVRVFDKDIISDDFMGASSFELQSLMEDEETELSLDLEDQDANQSEELGRIHIAVTLVPITEDIRGGYIDAGHLSPEDFPDNMSVTSWKATSLSRSDSNASDISRRTTISEMRFKKMKVPLGTATIQLVSGTDLPARDSNGFSDPYVKLQMGKQRHKSKVCYRTLDPIWKEEFVFQLTSRESLDREPAVIDMTVWDRDSYRKDDFIGRCELDLGSLEYDKTHSFTLNLIDAPGSILILVTLQSCIPSDIHRSNNELVHLTDQYKLFSTFSDISNIGLVEVKIIRANGCKAADLGGKSDPFCVVELCNSRAQTHTCYKTLDPVWNKTIKFPIKDVHDVLDFTVYDEDKDEKNDFLGRLAIPLLRVKNGVEKTYVLKDGKLLNKSKGTITIQVTFIFNPARAAIRTFSPREPKLMEQEPRFKRQLLLRNFHRVWNCLQAILQTAEFINSCFTWENSARSATAFIVYLLLVWNVELYMLPILLLLLLLKNYFAIVVQKTKVDRRVSSKPNDGFNDDDDIDDDVEDASNKVSFFQRLKAIEECLLKVQNILDWIACLLERIHNTFTWTVPFLSTLAIIVLSIVVIILYFIPIRTIAILWGINKFTKRLRKPNFIPNNELLDFLSRIPSEVQLDEYQELSSLQGSPKTAKKRK